MSGAEPPPAAPDPRPRPLYGEYATPEEQRAAIREPALAASTPAAHVPMPAPVGHPPPAHPTTRAARPSRTSDRVITAGLLIYGLITVISAVPQLWNFDEFAQTWMNLAGIDATFSNTTQGLIWGHIASIVFISGWLATALWAFSAVMRGKLAWWIPLVGAIATFVVVSVCLTVPLLGDPAIAAHFAV